ncbi:hypothetical protein F5X71_13165 [Nocardia brasiliensis]|uniref:Polysaccharide biosynthesis protein n=1 Tax=Nocardia brasiliensis TaxID=37326 RepID=A0A6G9XQE7_NOCBR|nr:hypothetical protein [Nocardia brasiliensis]QIS03134.1 hypothetical protein F5X71_13165 [Nocardia brasiliensis]
MVSPPAARPTRPAPATVLTLLAGRGGFRLTYQGIALVLLGVWGADRFAEYASAVGATAWIALLSSGPEKSVLKLLPRLRHTGAVVVRTAVLTSAVPLVLALLASAVSAGSAFVVYPLAAAWSASIGLLTVLVAAHRAAGRPERDSGGFLLLAVAMAAAVGAGAAWGFSPAVQLAVLLTVTLCVAGWAARGVRSMTARPRRGSILAIVRAQLLLGLYEPLGSAAVGVLYATLALSGQRAGSTTLYVALLVSSVIGSGTLYLLRIYQPVSSLRLRGAGAHSGIGFARRLLRAASGAGVLGCVLALVLAGSVSATALVVVLLCFEIAVHALVSAALFLLENTGPRELRVAALGAATQFGAAALLAALLVPAYGPPAALGALVASYAVLAASTLPRLTRAAAARGALGKR